jgi:hypothetical protein
MLVDLSFYFPPHIWARFITGFTRNALLLHRSPQYGRWLFNTLDLITGEKYLGTN